MKYAAIALIAAVEARHHHHPHHIENLMVEALPVQYSPLSAEKSLKATLGHEVIPANREDFSNEKELWKGDWKKYVQDHPHDQDCTVAESDNWKGAQQCSQSWDCRGARLCERGGWCSGYDGCEGTPLPMQSPGLSHD